MACLEPFDHGASGRMRSTLAAAALALTCCLGGGTVWAKPVTVKIVAFNDFHGNLAPPRQSITAPLPGGGTAAVPAGGAAYLVSAIKRLEARSPNHVTVAAGDLIGASPLLSALFLDEPSIEAMNLAGLDFSAVGNHELDRSRPELQRLAHGGCQKLTTKQPCAVDKDFTGANFHYLTANILTETGAPLFDPYAIRTFGKGKGRVRVAFIGLTLKSAPEIVSPSGVAGLSFKDEADTVNALVPKLRKAGADAIVLLIHQGGVTTVGYNDKSCAGFTGAILPILDRLDSRVDVVLSGHTHEAYVCDYGRINPNKPFLLTSAGLNGKLLTDVTLTIDPAHHRVTGKRADNVIVQGEAYTGNRGPVPLQPTFPVFPADPAAAALVARYAAAAPLASQTAGHLTGAATRVETLGRETVIGDLVADAELAATRDTKMGGAQIAMINAGGVRAELIPGAGGAVAYDQLFTVQPFGDALIVVSLTGRQIKDALEAEFPGANGQPGTIDSLMVSSGARYSFDAARPVGQRIVALTLDGKPVEDATAYRVTLNTFLAQGGGGFEALAKGTQPLGGPQDIDALQAYLSGAPVTPPTPDRVTNLSARP